jgi:hypothetical protein
MTKPSINKFVGHDIGEKKYGVALQAKVRQRINFDYRFQKEHQLRLRAEAKFRQLQFEFAVLSRRNEQAVLDGSAADHAHLLALEAAERLATASKNARIEAERKLKTEQEAAELSESKAEADRNAWQLQEQTNVLLRKAEHKARERLASESMASKAAAFKLQTERELAVLAEQRAYAELQIAHEAELKLRVETKELALTNDLLASMRKARSISGERVETDPHAIDESLQWNNDQAALAPNNGATQNNAYIVKTN